MILTSGAFDGVHAGHVAYLEAAKALCEGDELLVCAIAPDEYIVAAKGREPYWHQHDRLRTVSALGCVDAAIPQHHQTVAELISQHRPRLFIKGPDWEGRLPESIQRACSDVGTVIGYVDTPGTHVSETQISDEAALAQFEALVLSQKPAEKPWEPVTDYRFCVREEIEGQHPRLIEDVFQPRRVLDAGCGAQAILVKLLRQLGQDAIGFDVNADGVTGIVGDLLLVEDDSWMRSDLVICREVLEHLTIQQIRLAVCALCRLSTKHVYLTTRFAEKPAHFLSVDTADDLDPTHITMLNQHFLRMLFVLEGFRRRADLEERMDHQNKKRVLVYERT